MTTNVVNLFPERRIADFQVSAIDVNDWSERLVRASVKWLHHRRSHVLTFMTISATIDSHVLIIEFDASGRNPEIVSGSTDRARGWVGGLLSRTLLPNMVFTDEPCGYLLDSPTLMHPAQFVFIPLPTGSQLFAAIVF